MDSFRLCLIKKKVTINNFAAWLPDIIGIGTDGCFEYRSANLLSKAFVDSPKEQISFNFRQLLVITTEQNVHFPLFHHAVCLHKKSQVIKSLSRLPTGAIVRECLSFISVFLEDWQALIGQKEVCLIVRFRWCCLSVSCINKVGRGRWHPIFC